jgi:hypothetical protein
VAQPIFVKIIKKALNCVRIFRKTAQEKNRPKGEKSPNLVTLLDVVKRDSEKIVGRM